MDLVAVIVSIAVGQPAAELDMAAVAAVVAIRAVDRGPHITGDRVCQN